MTKLPASALRLAVRGRYVLLAVLAAVGAVFGYRSGSHGPTDWLIFEVGARTLSHWHHMAIYNQPRLHLYADNSFIQIGPPALLTIVPFEWLSPHVVNMLFVGIMAGFGIISIAAVESAARTVRPERNATIQRFTLLGGAGLAIAWGWECGQYHHLDDVLALTGTAIALWLCARGRSMWWIGVALGVAVASKPWAIVVVPLLWGLPRPRRAAAALSTVGVATVFWAPFVLAAPATIGSLGGYRIYSRAGAILWLLGVHGDVAGWLRPVQFTLGLVVAGYVAHRGHWTAAPLAGIAARVALDPYAWAYYGLGPVLAALCWDLTKPRRDRVPTWTLWTLLVEFGLRLPVTGVVPAVGKLLWVVSVFALVVWRTGQPQAATQPELAVGYDADEEPALRTSAAVA